MNIGRSNQARLIPVLLIAGLTACGQPAGERTASAQEAALSTAAAAPEQADAAAARDEAASADAAREEAEAAAREREAALEAREEEIARREAELDARRAAAARSAAPAKKPARVAQATSRAAPIAADATHSHDAAMPPTKVTTIVPAGTPLSVSLIADVSTQTARVGDPVEGLLTSDIVIDGRRVVPAGARVRGTVSQVISGSNAIGGVPTLGLTLDTLELPDGGSVSISGAVVQQLRSETARDTAKIVGGAAAGAVIGHQVDDDKGKVIGGILGGAVGALAAKKTGGNVVLPEGTVLSVTVDAPFEVTN